MVLSNPVLRDEAPVKAISYLEVVMLHYTDLVQAVKSFPEVSHQVHRVRVKIAVMRGVIMVARALKDLAFREECDISEITEEVEQLVVQKVLAGKVGGNTRSSDLDKVKARTATRTRRSAVPDMDSPRRFKSDIMMSGVASVRRSSTDTLSNGHPAYEVSPEIEVLSHAVNQLSVRIDNLCNERRSSRVERM
mmetsp:Transcript_78758/g.244359  ORF Transcript_78758/g.244359 Transcript_78758/m.244359 type:complete len:192 (-) Transcript_78758:52-627(-)